MTIDVSFTGSIPEIYERYLAPLCFEPYATELAARVRDVEVGAVLELAAGTGVLTRALARALPPKVRIVATDLNPGMIEVGARAASFENVTWKQADAQKLPFADGEFAAVVCQFGMMFLPDKLAGLREARRVLARGGRFVFNVWDELRLNEVSEIVGQAVAALFPANPPQFFARTPFGYHDPERLRADAESAGFQRVTIDVVDCQTRATSADAALALVQGTPMRGELEARGANLTEVTAKVTEVLTARLGATLESRMRARVVTAWT